MRTRTHFPTAVLITGLLVLAGRTMMPRLSIQPESRLWMEGTSSIHDWTMTVGRFDGSIAATADEVGAVEVTVPINQLKSDNRTMDKKAHDALKADKHATISYRFATGDLAGATEQCAFALAAKGQLSIAGVTKPVTFTVKGQQRAEGAFRYTGSTPVKMSDFGIDPPTAMLGTLKTGNKVVVHFDITAR